MESQNYDNFGHDATLVRCPDHVYQHQDSMSRHSTCPEVQMQGFEDIYQESDHIRCLQMDMRYCDNTSERRALLETGGCQHHAVQSYGDSSLSELNCNGGQTSEDDSQSSQPTNTCNAESSEDGSEQKQTHQASVRIPLGPIIIYQWTCKNFLCMELIKEFKKNRFWLNHFEFVDFTIFEYGDRTYYHLWRTFSLTVTFLLGFYVFLPGIGVIPQATPVAGFIFMHCWLHFLLICHSLLEVAALSYSLYTMTSPVVAKVHYTPRQFQMIWLLYNTLYPNLMSCNFMYYIVVTDMEKFIGDYRICTAVLASFVSIQVSVTAMPSRLAHIVHPLAFNIIHIVFTMSYQIAGFTNPAGANYVYPEIDWKESRLLAVCYSMSWIFVTCLCHLLIVFCCWCRRLVYRHKRRKIFRCVYGISPDEYCLFDDEFDPSVNDSFHNLLTARSRHRPVLR